MFATLSDAMTSTMPASDSSAVATAAIGPSVCGAVLIADRASGASMSAWCPANAGSAAARPAEIASSSGRVPAMVWPGRSWATATSIHVRGSASGVVVPSRMKSFASQSKLLNGTQTSGAAIAIDPPKPASVTPTIVNLRPFRRRS